MEALVTYSYSLFIVPISAPFKAVSQSASALRDVNITAAILVSQTPAWHNRKHWNMRHFRGLFLMNNTSGNTKLSCISNVQLMNSTEMLILMYDNTDFFVYFTISVHSPKGQVTTLAYIIYMQGIKTTSIIRQCGWCAKYPFVHDFIIGL